MKVMETIPYRRTKLHIRTIPKGTLLFRIVKRPIDDLRGVKLEDGTRCLTPNYSVYFYPNPWAGKMALDLWVTTEKTVKVYMLTKDIKILWLLKPSKYSRIAKNTRRIFVKQCSKVPQGCLPKKGVGYNPCFSETMIKKYPDVVGYAAIAPNDARRLNEKLRETRKLHKYFREAEDEFGSHSVPEIALHPLTSRPSKDVITKDSDVLENNYKLIKVLPANEWDVLTKYMDDHAVYNPDTFFYTYKE